MQARTGLLSIALLVAVTAACTDQRDEAAPTTTAAPVTSTTATTTTTTATTATTTTTMPALPPPPTTVAGPPATIISRGRTDRRMVALTFDAGADAGFTAEILDVLDRAGVPATFGITGRWALANPDLLRQVAAAHLVMNHTFEHRSFTGISARPGLLAADERRRDVERADEAIREVTGRTTRPWFRSPYGDQDASVNAVLGSLGYRYNVLWTVDSLGWQGLAPAAITSRCLARAVPGAILLFHVGAQSHDAAALPGIIAGLRQAGFGFGTVADVVGA